MNDTNGPKPRLLSPRERTAIGLSLRLFRILMLVGQRRAGQRVGRKQLAEVCECNLKIIGRDITILQAEYGLYWDPAERTYKLPRDGHPLATIPLTLVEAFALVAAGAILRSPQFPQHEQAASALDKVVGALPPLLRSAAEAAQINVPPAVLPRDYGRVALQQILQAVPDRQTLRLDYESYSSGRAWRDIDPYAVEPRDGIYYELHGWCHKNREIRTFALDRVGGVERLGRRFVRDEIAWAKFTRQQGIGGIRGTGETQIVVDVRFSPKTACYARNYPWSESLTVVDCDVVAGAVRLQGRVADGIGCDALINQLLRWRRHVTVLGGNKLYQTYRDELNVMLAQHPEKNSTS